MQGDSNEMNDRIVEEEILSDAEGGADVPARQQGGISEIFHYFSEHAGTDISNGRAMGRKIGVMQEILVRKYLLQSQRLADAVIFEPGLPGYSQADHKVEFVLFQPVQVLEFRLGDDQEVSGFRLRLMRIDESSQGNLRARFNVSAAGFKTRTDFGKHLGPSNKRVRELLKSARLTLRLSDVTDDSARVSVLNLSSGYVRASIESKRVGAQRFADSDRLGAGIQTIEKAKQAALVAIDADLLLNNQVIKALTPRGERRRYISIVVLGNGVHWTLKDIHVLETYVDHTFLMRDEAIIRYADTLRRRHRAQQDERADGESFKDYFMRYFGGMTRSLADDFGVLPTDFRRMEVIIHESGEREVVYREAAPSLIEILEGQIGAYDGEPTAMPAGVPTRSPEQIG